MLSDVITKSWIVSVQALSTQKKKKNSQKVPNFFFVDVLKHGLLMRKKKWMSFL